MFYREALLQSVVVLGQLRMLRGSVFVATSVYTMVGPPVTGFVLY